MKYLTANKPTLKISILVILITILNGCSVFKPYKAPITQGTIIKPSDFALLQPGLTPGQVKAILGPPYGQDPFFPSHWDYVFYTTNNQFDTKIEHHVTVNFDKEGYLLSWNKLKSKDILHPKDFWDSFFN